ncbi:hypothetical protein DFH11DRAFT_1830605 [Phellopilus nigrolimitatus]|nr:hypothetical protein DFH11DRAFT_1830605 [Phellopilus nigrolimitatus]
MHSIRSDIVPVDPSLVPFFVSGTYLVRYTQVALLTFLVYDSIITMDKEIRYFWNRYIGLLGAVSGIARYGFTLMQGLADILLMRVLALYHQDKRLAACLRALFGLEAAFTLGILIYDNIYQETIVGELAEGVTFCGQTRNPPKVWDALSWATPMLYGIILMVLALYKAAEHWRETAGFG